MKHAIFLLVVSLYAAAAADIAALKKELANVKSTVARMEATIALLEGNNAIAAVKNDIPRAVGAILSPEAACPCSTAAHPCPPRNETYTPGRGACCHGAGPDAPCETSIWTAQTCSAMQGNTWCPVPNPNPGPAPPSTWNTSVTIGDGTQGTTTFAVAQYFTEVGQINGYFHLRMPGEFKKNVVESHMFHITVTGYAYQAGAPIDLVFVGYKNLNTPNNPYLERLNVLDRAKGMSCTNNSTSYWGSDNNLYLRFQVFTMGGKPGPGNIYYASFRVDSMNVGNGIQMKRGDISVIMSEKPEL